MKKINEIEETRFISDDLNNRIEMEPSRSGELWEKFFRERTGSKSVLGDLHDPKKRTSMEINETY